MIELMFCDLFKKKKSVNVEKLDYNLGNKTNAYNTIEKITMNKLKV